MVARVCALLLLFVAACAHRPIAAPSAPAKLAPRVGAELTRGTVPPGPELEREVLGYVVLSRGVELAREFLPAASESRTEAQVRFLGLLGIDPAGLPYIGRNLLGAAGDGPILRPYGEWIDSHHLFFTRGTALACFDLAGQPVGGEACDRSDREAKRMREVSRLVVTADLQTTLRARLGPDGRERD